jgi:sugar lactone lactonase YvrE
MRFDLKISASPNNFIWIKSATLDEIVISPQGKQLGTIELSEQPANLAWGDADRQTLYVTARTGLYRVRLSVPGAGVAAAVSP